MTSFCLDSSSTTVRYVVKNKGARSVTKGFDKKTKRLVFKEKRKGTQLIYRVYFNEKGKIDRSVNRKGVEKQHKRGCNC
jgi:hypothetical protein